MRCKVLFVLLVLFLLPALALASSQVSITPIKNSITLIEPALFKLSITNEAEEKQRYSIFSFVQGWDIEPFPLKDKIIDIQPGKTATTTIKAKPITTFSPGLYQLALNIESDAGEKYTESLAIYVNPEKPLDYLPAIKVIVDMDTRINPQELQAIKLLLENKNPLNLPELIIKLQSDLVEFNKETATSLSGLGKKTVEFSVAPDVYQKPGEYFLFFTFEKGGEIVKVINQKIEIIPLTLPFQTKLAQESSFLKTTKLISVKNPGNVRNNQNITLAVSFWENLFSQSTGQSIKMNGQRHLFWEVTLSPEEALVLTAVFNYRYPFYLLLLFLVLLSLYFYLQSPLSLSKTATSTKKDSTLSELRITLHLKNLANQPLNELEVIDLIPGIADIEKSLELGTLKPQEIKHTRKGTLVKWKLAEIEPKEVRLISYQIKSRLKIVGALKLPRARVLYGPKTKRKTAYSNLFRISS